MILSFLTGKRDEKFSGEWRRKHARHAGGRGEVRRVGANVNGFGARDLYSLRDWSLGGVSFETGPDSGLMRGDRVMLEVSFRVSQGVVNVELPVRVVRTAKRVVAAEFAALLDGPTRRQLERVIDDLNTQAFAASQAV